MSSSLTRVAKKLKRIRNKIKGILKKDLPQILILELCTEPREYLELDLKVLKWVCWLSYKNFSF